MCAPNLRKVTFWIVIFPCIIYSSQCSLKHGSVYTAILSLRCSLMFCNGEYLLLLFSYSLEWNCVSTQGGLVSSALPLLCCYTKWSVSLLIQNETEALVRNVNCIILLATRNERCKMVFKLHFPHFSSKSFYMSAHEHSRTQPCAYIANGELMFEEVWFQSTFYLCCSLLPSNMLWLSKFVQMRRLRLWVLINILNDR